MTVELMALCDYAQEQMGKLTIVGTFDTLYVSDFPATHPSMSVALRLRFPIYELGRHEVGISFRAPDGSDLVPPFSGSMTVNGIGNDSAVSDLTLHLGNVRFERENAYRLILVVDGVERAQVPLYVRRAPKQGDSPVSR